MNRSRIKCLSCEIVIESKHRHDFVVCPCQDVALDGGLDYQRILWKPGAPGYIVVGDDE